MVLTTGAVSIQTTVSLLPVWHFPWDPNRARQTLPDFTHILVT